MQVKGITGQSTQHRFLKLLGLPFEGNAEHPLTTHNKTLFILKTTLY